MTAREREIERTKRKPSSRAVSRARMRRMRRRRIRNTILLLLILVTFGCGGGYLVYKLQGGSFSSPFQEFDASREFENTLVSKESQKAPAFAAELCVVEGDVPLETVSLQDEQKGLLLNLDSKETMYAKGAYERVYPASITKIMTAILAFQYGNMEDVVTISQENVTLEEGSQVCGFWAGDQVTMDELVHCLLVYSGNDAASAIATHVGGSTENFVNMMNSYAASLG